MAAEKKYGIIYVDPPWRYEQRSIQGGAEKHYPTMSLEELCALPVAQLADKDCALFLWTTFPKLKESFRVMDAWGFTYRTLAFLWLKQNRKADTWFYGMGFWTRSNAEVCLLAVNGHPRVELFARQKAPGWDAWGNEVDCDLVMPERSV